MDNYKKFLANSYQSDMIAALSAGSGLGFVMGINSFSYALAIWFGAKMILYKGYTGGEVFTVILAVLIGSSQEKKKKIFVFSQNKSLPILSITFEFFHFSVLLVKHRLP